MPDDEFIELADPLLQKFEKYSADIDERRLDQG